MKLDTAYWKTLPKQTHFSGAGRVGDCWRCCIAAILKLPAHEVPHFVKKAETSYLADTQKWLNDRGFVIIETEDVSFSCWGSHRESCWYPMICSGPTVRSKSKYNTHAVIMSGDDVIYDPHPSEDGLLAVTTRFLVVPSYS